MAAALANYPPVIDSAGASVNPTTTTVLADTGAVASALYMAIVTAYATADATFVVQHRNAANAANVDDVITFSVLAGATIALPFKFALNAQERIRCLVAANLTGTANVSIQAWRIA